MKTKPIKLVIGLSTLAVLTALGGPQVVVVAPAPVVTVPAPVVVAPAPVVAVPAPAVTVSTVPDSYVWDGTEFVGVVGTDYYYLGPDHIWLRADAPRLVRFHDWERSHADWRAHAIRNDLYRHDAHGHVVPYHYNGGHDDHGHDMNHLHDH